MNPLQELCRYLVGWGTLCRGKHRYGELLGIEVAQDIVGDAVTEHNRKAREAYATEQRQREALARIQAAQCPTSPGGVAITPCEAQGFVPLIASSAEALHDLSEEVNPQALSS